MTEHQDAEVIRAIIAWNEAYMGGEEPCTLSLARHLDSRFPGITAKQIARCEFLCDDSGSDEKPDPAKISGYGRTACVAHGV